MLAAIGTTTCSYLRYSNVIFHYLMLFTEPRIKLWPDGDRHPFILSVYYGGTNLWSSSWMVLLLIYSLCQRRVAVSGTCTWLLLALQFLLHKSLVKCKSLVCANSIFFPITHSGPEKWPQDGSVVSLGPQQEWFGSGFHLSISLHKLYFITSTQKVWIFSFLQCKVSLERSHRTLWGRLGKILVMTLQVTLSRANILPFNQLALGLGTGLDLENQWEIVISSYNSWHEPATHHLSFLKIAFVVFLPIRLHPSPLSILTLETLWSNSHQPRSSPIKESWWSLHCFCPLLGWSKMYRQNQGTFESEIWHYS